MIYIKYLDDKNGVGVYDTAVLTVGSVQIIIPPPKKMNSAFWNAPLSSQNPGVSDGWSLLLWISELAGYALP